MITKLDENHIASFGGFRRMRRWAWREGRVLKNDKPGMSNVCMILGLKVRWSAMHEAVANVSRLSYTVMWFIWTSLINTVSLVVLWLA